MADEYGLNGAAQIKVVGVGGGGCNAVDRMIANGVRGVEYIGMNTDVRALAKCQAPVRLQLGPITTGGKGAGGKPEVGRASAEESVEEIAELLQGADMVFVVAGMGGGSGTGASPLVAKAARSVGALTVGNVTLPFSWEGKHRSGLASTGVEGLRENVDALIVIPNDRLLAIVEEEIPLLKAFVLADEMLRQGVEGIVGIIDYTADINVDFNDVRETIKGAGSALLSIGVGRGPERARDAAEQAVYSRLLDRDIRGAKSVLFEVRGDASMSLYELQAAADIISDLADADASIIWGGGVDEHLEDEMQIRLIAAGFDGREPDVIDAAWSSASAAPVQTKAQRPTWATIDVPGMSEPATLKQERPNDGKRSEAEEKPSGLSDFLMQGLRGGEKPGR
jgi:cell division protein FtsZ